MHKSCMLCSFYITVVYDIIASSEVDAMNIYIARLMSCGYSMTDAYMTYHDFVKNYTLDDLEYFIQSLEEV